MANRARGEASFTRENGEVITLVINYDALAEAEDIADLEVNALLKALANSPRMKILRAIVYGALRERHPDIDLPSVGDMLLGPDASGMSTALGQAISRAFPQVEAAGSGIENPPQAAKAAPGAGTKSSARGRKKD